MKKTLSAIFLRLALFVAPFVLLYLYAEHAFEHARTQEHHGDTGLGIAILLFFVAIVMLFGFFIDLLIHAYYRRAAIALVDIALLTLLLSPIGWFSCHWYGGDGAFCRSTSHVFETLLEPFGR